MSWRLVGVRDQRVEFVVRASRGESLSSLCREFEISRPTGYLWLKRFGEQGVAGVEEHSRRPHLSPRRTAAGIEARIVALRRQRPDWGARKLAVLLEREGLVLPVITVHRVLVRHDLVLDRESRRQATGRFEREQPNQLWQMDFKGQKGTGAAIGPLSVLDDHNRYLVALEQTGTTRSEAVRERLEGAFRTSGLPEALLMDHGVPWWNARSPNGWTHLMVWLMKQGVSCCFSGVRHPQTQGKVERFHGSLERARSRVGAEQWLTQNWLDSFRHEYNELRPHEALGMRTPASLWRPSTRAYDPNPQAWDYGVGAELRKVGQQGHIYIGDRRWRVSQALAAHTVRLERIDQRVLVYFCRTLVQEIDLSGERSTAVERSPLNSCL
ncbi:MAG: IS481 family transposase [Terracidiphilus sp.]|jgi:transposase InsO family protein